MILQLILKDLRAYKFNIFGKILILWLLVGALVLFRFYAWDAYMMHACMAIAFATSFFSFIEKKQNSEIMTSSLPVNRIQIVTGRYITSLVIFSIGVGLWLMFASLAEIVYSESLTNIQQIFTPKVLIIALFFVSIHNGIFLPAIFSFRLLGVVLVFIIALIIAIFSTATIFKPYSPSFNFNIELNNLWGVIIILLVMFLLQFVSFFLSVQIYRHKDL